METVRLIKYLRGNRNYTFEIGHYLIPKQILTLNNNWTDLEDNRVRNLNQGSTWSPNFRNFLDTKYKSIEYIREFPLIIRNRDKWNYLCDKYNVQNNLRPRNYFLPDYFMFRYGFAVEIDSKLHNEGYDKARDEYIREEFGINIIRFYEYGRDSYQKFLNDFQFLVMFCQNSNRMPTVVDYTDIIINNYTTINKRAVRIIDKLVYSTNNLMFINTLIIKPENIGNKDFKYLQRKSKVLLEIKNYFKVAYGVDVIMMTSNPYT